jgi:Tol biopolymer transport system component
VFETTSSELAFLTHERLEGETLSHRLGAGPLPIQDVLRYALDLASALNQGHSQDIVHGDVRPERIVLTSGGARLLQPGVSESRPQIHPYVAPEVVRGEPAEARSDIFSFGAIVYEMATGWRAFHGDTEDALGAAILTGTPPPLGKLISGQGSAAAYADLERVIAGCLQKDPDKRRQRIQNASLELKLVARALGRQTAGARRAAPAPPPMPVQAPAAGNGDASLAAPPLAYPPPGAPPPMAPVPAPPAPAPPSDTMPAAPPPMPAPFETPPVLPVFVERWTAPAPVAEHPADAPEPVIEPVIEPVPEPEPETPLLRPLRPRILFEEAEVVPAPGKSRRVIFVAIALVAVVLSALGVYAFLLRAPAPRAIKFDVAPPEHTSYPGMAAVSPDGRFLTFSALGPEGKRLLWLRPLDAIHASTIPGTEGAFAPFWSPDSQYIGFFSEQSLEKVRASGGAPVTLGPAESLAGGGTWNNDGVIVFARSLVGGLYKVGAAGGTPTPLTKLNEQRHELAHMWPRFLPDGKHFLFFVLSDFEDATGVYAGSLDGQEPVRLLTTQTNAVYSSGGGKGYLIYMRDRAMMANQFDASSLKVVGSPFTLADEVGAILSMGLAPVSSSENGILVYQSLGKPTRQLVWYDRAGRQIGVLGEPAEYGPQRISPDGKKVVVGRLARGAESADLWVFDAASGAMTQLTNTPSTHEGSPIWSPDGNKVAFFWNPEGTFDIYQKPAVNGEKADLLTRTSGPKFPTDWSPDGKYIIFSSIEKTTKSDIWYMPVSGDRKPVPYVQTIYNEGYAAFSPDGKWAAYHSDQSGRVEVYVQRFPPTAEGTQKRWQVSAGNGSMPRWRHDGKEMFFITDTGKLMSAKITTEGDEFSSEPPAMLFQSRPIPKRWNLFDVSPDGDRFLLNLPLEWSSSAPITVITNWTDKLKR